MYLILSHNDLDGVSCGIVARCAFGAKADLRYNSVEGLDHQVKRYLETFKEKGTQADYLFITDLSVNEENEAGLTEYSEAGGKVKLIDHHKTALHLNRHHWGSVQVQYDDGRLASATSLFYDYLIQHGLLTPNAALDEYVELVRQYDTWEWDEKGNTKAKRLNDLFYLLSIDEFEEKMVERLQRQDSFDFDDFEQKVLDMEEEKIERYVRRKRRELVQTFIQERCVGIVHAESYHSELGNELGRDNPHFDYIAIINMGGRKISFRTIHDHIDVSEIAGVHGGGGHAKAAGCSLTKDAYKLYVGEPFLLEPVRVDAFRNVYNVKGSPFGCLYDNRKGDLFFIYANRSEWVVEMNGEKESGSYASFEEAEMYMKRNYQASLVRDERFVKHLMQFRAGKTR
ncbi:DHH family phosphoesterase [Paenibacillus turpanensis]|uniref:DHH family phosphoesterase n=1 Tax=Paenibacillus turpanensis TaxID=2689078 RepID=UPI00140A3953|nr:oligoribonuclease [Paenibacillus turpanensis]